MELGLHQADSQFFDPQLFKFTFIFVIHVLQHVLLVTFLNASKVIDLFFPGFLFDAMFNFQRKSNLRYTQCSHIERNSMQSPHLSNSFLVNPCFQHCSSVFYLFIIYQLMKMSDTKPFGITNLLWTLRVNVITKVFMHIFFCLVFSPLINSNSLHSYSLPHTLFGF